MKFLHSDIVKVFLNRKKSPQLSKWRDFFIDRTNVPAYSGLRYSGLSNHASHSISMRGDKGILWSRREAPIDELLDRSLSPPPLVFMRGYMLQTHSDTGTGVGGDRVMESGL